MQHAFLENYILAKIQGIIEFHFERLVKDFVSILVSVRMLLVVSLVVYELLESAKGVETFVVEI